MKGIHFRSLTTIRALGATTLLLAFGACGDDDGPTGPTGIRYGETALVFLVNPIVNDINSAVVTTPDTIRSGVDVLVPLGPSDDSDSAGVAVLVPMPAGEQTVRFTRDTLSDEVGFDIAARDLRDVAVAFTPAGASVMTDVLYEFGGEVVEVGPNTSIDDVNSALSRSNVIVFFRRGVYHGDLAFSGSNVTLFGEGSIGGMVTIDGNVTVNGSGNRIRGTHVTGSLTVPASGFGISFSRVDGALAVSGSSAVFLNNTFCGEDVSISASVVTALGNRGLAPLPRPALCGL